MGVKRITRYTPAEFEAHVILVAAGLIPLDTKPGRTREAANWIVALADRIKSERAEVLLESMHERHK